MKNKLLSIKERLLMGPGPSCLYPEVYGALACKTIGSQDPHFISIMDDITLLLQKLFNTENKVTLPVSGTGSTGMEIAFVNLIEPGDKILVLSNGIAGIRMYEAAKRLGANVDLFEANWGEAIDPEEVKKTMSTKIYSHVAIVHAETSTGVCNPVYKIGKLVKDIDALYIVDTVTSLGGMPVHANTWNADAVYSTTQRCISCPAGLAPVTFSDKALRKIQKRRSRIPNSYLDLSNYWDGESRTYFNTVPINIIYGLYQALFCIFDEGIDTVFQRHLDCHTTLVSSLESMGLEMFVEPEWRLPMLNTVKIPDGIDEAAIRSTLLENSNIEIGTGPDQLKGKIWRIGIMGHSARQENVDHFTQALKKLL